MNTIKTVLTTIILALFLANCVQLDFIVNCKTVGQNKNIKENKEAPDKSWSVTIANQDTYKSSISTTSMMVLTRKTVVIEWKIAGS
jgi:PBP1b-binding outer membrane lipoprotein LpoB